MAHSRSLHGIVRYYAVQPEGGEGVRGEVGGRGVKVAIIVMVLSIRPPTHVRNQELRAFTVAVMAMYVTFLMRLCASLGGGEGRIDRELESPCIENEIWVCVARLNLE